MEQDNSLPFLTADQAHQAASELAESFVKKHPEWMILQEHSLILLPDNRYKEAAGAIAMPSPIRQHVIAVCEADQKEALLAIPIDRYFSPGVCPDNLQTHYRQALIAEERHLQNIDAMHARPAALAENFREHITHLFLHDIFKPR